MPRTMNENSPGAFRVVIEKTTAGGTNYKLHYGPYAKKGNAKGVLTTELGWVKKWLGKDEFAEGWIEQTASQWERVAD